MLSTKSEANHSVETEGEPLIQRHVSAKREHMLGEEHCEVGQQDAVEIPEIPSHPVIMIYVLMITNIAVFLYEMYLARWQFAPVAQNPMIGPSWMILLDAGAKDVNRIVNRREIWRLVSPMFLHAGVIHLFVNMIALRNVGSVIEAQYGGFKVWMLYLVSGVSGCLLSCLFLPNQIGIGASGAIFGLVGANYADLFHLWRFIEDRWSQLVSLLVPTVVGLLIGLLPMMDNFAHLGGLISGVCLGTGMLGFRRLERFGGSTYLIIKRLVRLVSFILVVLWFMAIGTAVFSGEDGAKMCGLCKYAGCMDTQWWTCPTQTCQLQFSNGTVVTLDWGGCQN